MSSSKTSERMGIALPIFQAARSTLC